MRSALAEMLRGLGKEILAEVQRAEKGSAHCAEKGSANPAPTAPLPAAARPAAPAPAAASSGVAASCTRLRPARSTRSLCLHWPATETSCPSCGSQDDAPRCFSCGDEAHLEVREAKLSSVTRTMRRTPAHRAPSRFCDRASPPWPPAARRRGPPPDASAAAHDLPLCVVRKVRRYARRRPPRQDAESRQGVPWCVL